MQTPAVSRLAPGRRRLSPEAIAHQAAAREGEGLPPGVSPGQALAAFKRAAPRLGLARLRDLTDQLMAYSRPQDWEPGARPVVWPGNRLLAAQLEVSERHLRRLLAQLIEAGIIVPVDSPDGRRWGNRDEGGRIREAYGFDLSPLALRYAEFRRLADAAERERKAFAALRRRLTIARQAIAQLAETARQSAAAGGDWEAWLTQALALAAGAAREGTPLRELEQAVITLEGRRAEGEAALLAALAVAEKKDMSAAADSEVLPTTTTTERQADPSATGNGSRPGAEGTAGSEAAGSETRGETAAPAVTPRFLLHLSPPLAEQVFRCSPDWPDIIAAAGRLRQTLGIGQAAWGEACLSLGRPQAAMAVAIIAAKQAEIRSPGNYLRALAARARRGELHLLRSLYGLADRASCRARCSGRSQPAAATGARRG